MLENVQVNSCKRNPNYSISLFKECKCMACDSELTTVNEIFLKKSEKIFLLCDNCMIELIKEIKKNAEVSIKNESKG